MHRGTWTIAGVAIALGLVACAPSPTSDSAWSADVHWSELEAGTCLQSSYLTDDEVAERFDPDALNFHVVGCDQPHLGETVDVVLIPGPDEWEGYGTAADLPTIAQAKEWLRAVCDAHQALIAAFGDEIGVERKFIVSPNYGFVNSSRLGSCIAYDSEGATIYGDALPLAEIVRWAGTVQGFDASLPDSVDNWATSRWASKVPRYMLEDGMCLQDPDPEDLEYLVVSCVGSFVAQLVDLVPDPEDWENGFDQDRADELAAAFCAESAATLETPPEVSIVVVPIEVGEGYIREDFIGGCLATAVDGSELSGSLLPSGDESPAD
jgi:hypothetical protein